jgi:hypothetical protein
MGGRLSWRNENKNHANSIALFGKPNKGTTFTRFCALNA